MNAETTNTETLKLAMKLYWMQYDPYTQLDMGNDEPVWQVDIEMVDGSTETVTVTNRDGDFDNFLAYKMFQETKNGYRQIHWEQTAIYKRVVMHQ